MMNYEIAKAVYDELCEKANKSSIEGIEEFYEEFLQSAVNYAKTRAAWHFMSREEKMTEDSNRSAKHNDFISTFHAVCRNLGVEVIDKIPCEALENRKTIGDFACYIALFLALENR
ncbi:MAG: hypothetical protein J6A68_02780 [Oscillospiraceae bacterium]|nr:hypothetical protein [Oscillospiraceae bacterium]